MAEGSFANGFRRTLDLHSGLCDSPTRATALQKLLGWRGIRPVCLTHWRYRSGLCHSRTPPTRLNSLPSAPLSSGVSILNCALIHHYRKKRPLDLYCTNDQLDFSSPHATV